MQNSKEKVIYFILISIPLLFGLFLLAMVNVLLMLLCLIGVLAVLLFLKNKRPQWFELHKAASKQEETLPPMELPPRQHVYMVLTGNEDIGARRIVVNKPSYVIGRSVYSDFKLESKRIGRRHLSIEYDPLENQCFGIDQGSVNGTFLNNERMSVGKRYRLTEGDRIMIDGCEFVVEYAHF